MLSNKNIVQKNGGMTLEGQEVSESVVDSFDDFSDKDIDDIDKALEAATLRDESAPSNHQSSAEDWDAVPNPNKSEETVEASPKEQEEIDVSGDQDVDRLDDSAFLNEPKEKVAVIQAGISKKIFIGTVIAICALSGTGFYLLNNSLNETKSGFIPIEEAIAELESTQIENHRNNTSLVNKVNASEASLQNVAAQIKGLASDFKLRALDVTKELERIKSDVMTNTSSIETSATQIKSLVGEMRQIDSHMTNVISEIKRDVKTKAKLVSSRPVTNTENSLEGATLESVDLWNYNSYANLRTTEGAWIPLKVSERFKGWIIKHINKDSVVFTRNGQDKTLFING